VVGTLRMGLTFSSLSREAKGGRLELMLLSKEGRPETRLEVKSVFLLSFFALMYSGFSLRLSFSLMFSSDYYRSS
jgi:hypothetical protein